MSDLLKKTRNSLICSFLWATWATSLIEKEGISKSHVLKNLQKNVLTKIHFSQIFWANRLFFVSKRANERFAQKNEQFAHLLVYHERLERIAHGGSFDMSDLSNSLTVAHLSWAIWANRSQLLIWSERSEGMSRWANKRIPNPDLNLLCHRGVLFLKNPGTIIRYTNPPNPPTQPSLKSN